MFRTTSSFLGRQKPYCLQCTPVLNYSFLRKQCKGTSLGQDLRINPLQCFFCDSKSNLDSFTWSRVSTINQNTRRVFGSGKKGYQVWFLHTRTWTGGLILYSMREDLSFILGGNSMKTGFLSNMSTEIT